MAKKNKIDYAELSTDELNQRLSQAKEELFQLRFRSATAPLKNPHAITSTRKEIARLATFLRQKGGQE